MLEKGCDEQDSIKLPRGSVKSNTCCETLARPFSLSLSLSLSPAVCNTPVCNTPVCSTLQLGFCLLPARLSDANSDVQSR